MVFITSVRHPNNSNGPFHRVLELLEHTLRSVCAQTVPRFRVLVIANEPFELAFQDPRIEYIWVDHPPPSPLPQASFGMPPLRLDRGCKYAVGLLRARTLGANHVMFFDADDYVSNRLAALGELEPTKNGWYLSEGFVYDRARNEFGTLRDFHLRCGTSHVIHSSLFELPPDLSSRASREELLERIPEDYLLRCLGSHRWIAEHLAQRGHPLEPLPFLGAVYHLGHGENHTARSGMLDVCPLPLTAELREELGIPLGLAVLEDPRLPLTKTAQ